MNNKVRNIHGQNIIDILELLSSEELQLQYEKNVPHVDITNELVCMWFDDFYLPESKYVCESFTSEELKELKKFNEFYDDKFELLPDSQGTVLTWLKNKAWRDIMAEAQKTLRKLKT